MLAMLLAAALLAPVAQRVTEARFFRSWLEIERVRAGVSTVDPFRLSGQNFAADGSVTWGRRGDLSSRRYGTIRIDAKANPMRADFLSDEGEDPGKPPSVNPMIFKFGGEKLVIASRLAWPKERKLGPGEDYKERPEDFASTKDNGVTVETYKPCHMDDQD